MLHFGFADLARARLKNAVYNMLDKVLCRRAYMDRRKRLVTCWSRAGHVPSPRSPVHAALHVAAARRERRHGPRRRRMGRVGIRRLDRWWRSRWGGHRAAQALQGRVTLAPTAPSLGKAAARAPRG